MIEGARWRRWVFFNLPLALFVVGLLFPFYWMMVTTVRTDGELYRPWIAPNYTPFWTFHPTLDHIRYLLDETLFSRWMLNTFFISVLATAISLFCGLLAGYAALPAQISVRRQPRHGNLHHLSRTADAAVHSARRYHPQPSPWRYALGAHSHIPHLPHPVLHLAADGLLQGDPA